MCNPWPGTRCSTETRSKLDIYEAKFKDALDNFGEESHEFKKAEGKLVQVQKEYDATEQGMKDLEDLIENGTNVRPYRVRLEEAKKTYDMQKNALNEVRNGRHGLVTLLTENPDNFFEADELLSVTHAAREYNERMALRYGNEVRPVTANVYNKYLDGLEEKLNKEHNGEIPADKMEALNQLREMSPPDTINYKTYSNLPDALVRSREALHSEVDYAAALQNVDPMVAASFYEGYRKQYQKLYANLPPTERPDPPKTWVTGDYEATGYTRDYDSSFAPRDPASLYAIYRLRSDPNAIPESFKTYKDIASIDLETSGPKGKEGLQPKNGRIIEVGIINYDGKTGKETGRYSQLIRPEHLFLKKYGTGAEDVHHISVEDLEGQPAWETVKGDVFKHLEGKIMLAQNLNFEKNWLSHHGDSVMISQLAKADTLDISRKHLNLPNNKLQTICNEIGVAYTDGHRATHDAAVTGEAYFKLRTHVARLWRKKASRANAPTIKKLPQLNRFF